MSKFLPTLLALLFICTVVIAQPTAGLMAYWRMDGNYVDAGPNLINGTNFSSTATTNNKNVSNTAMAFANPSSTVPQYATHPVNANLNFGTSQNFTVDFSVLVTSVPHANGFYDNNLNSGGYGVWMWSSNGFPQIQFNVKSGSVGTTNGALPLNVWKHIACVRSGTTLSIYINGVLNVTGTAGTTAPTYTLPGYFGTMSYSGFTPPPYNGHNGKLDEFRIYNRALTAAEILALASVALPVKLTSFTGVNKNSTITLNWQTAYEQNSSYYSVQRSVDGINFTDVARVAANGISNTPLNYSHNDILPGSIKMHKTIFYRLKSVDIDGNFSHSDILAIQLDKTNMQLLVSPNPAKDILQVQTASGPAGSGVLIITDIAGMQLYRRDIMLQSGSNSIPVNISLLKPGIYNVRLLNGSESNVKQFVKE